VVQPGALRASPGQLVPVRRSGGPPQVDLNLYLRKILTARVYEAAVETPLDVAKRLSERVGNSVFLKREDLQPVFSFKARRRPTPRPFAAAHLPSPAAGRVQSHGPAVAGGAA